MELLFDDEWIDRKAGVKRVPGAVRREPEPVLKPEKPWEQHGVEGHQSLFYDKEMGKFRIWYRCSVLEEVRRGADQGVESSERESGKRRVFLCYAESADGLKWDRAPLGLFEFAGSRDNNILLEIAEGDSMFFNIVKDLRDPDPARRYKCIGFDRSATSGIRDIKPGGLGVCVGYSPDGLRWEHKPKLIMSTRELTDADCILGQREPTTGKWVAYFRPRTQPKRRYVGYSESDDFDHWTYPRMLITPDAGDDEWTEFYGMAVACVGRWRVGVLWVMHNNPEYSPMTNELVYSRGGLDFRRAMPGVQFIPLNPEGAFDSRMSSSVALIDRGTDFLCYYNGSNREHGSDRGQQMPPGRIAAGEARRGGLGLARIKGRNFCGLGADFDGLVETKWLCNYGNAGVSALGEIEKDGWIRAEILDQYGQVVPGWDRHTSRVRENPDGSLKLSWGREDLTGRFEQVSDAQGRVGHVVKLRFHLHRATLFGFQAGEEGAMPEYVS